MSFGFEYEVTEIAKAINDARARYRHPYTPLFFAAASNKGHNRQEEFPASHDSVFSIRATDHYGELAPFNAMVTSNNVIDTLGVDVKGAAKSGFKYDQGTSAATPIAAAIAALVLDGAKLDIGEHDQLWKLATQRGMWALFKLPCMGAKQPPGSVSLDPRAFCNMRGDERYLKMAYACSEVKLDRPKAQPLFTEPR